MDFRTGCRQKLNVYIRRHEGAKCARWALVIYHKFSHGAAFCTLNGKNVNAML